jgi:type IV pilus assembly protein PilB
MASRRIGQILVDLGFMTDEQLKIVLEEQEQQPGALLGRIAEDMQLITDEQLIQALAEQHSMQTVSLEEYKFDDAVMKMVSETMAQLYRIIPLAYDKAANRLTVACCDPQNLRVADELRMYLGHEIEIIVATERGISQALTRYFDSEAESVEKLIAELDDDEELKRAVSVLEGEKFNITDAQALADSAPVRKLLNMVLLLAIKDHASDIHFEPFEDEFRIRIKAEGVLYEMVPPPRHLAFAITTRIKVMASLDIAERRMPQDGRIELMVGGHPVDLRVSVLPTIFGESVVMRILDRSVVNLSLDNVGMSDEMKAKFRKAIDRPNGIVLVTGPTGSGKTTTLYSSLSELNSVEDKIITTEDPVEYDIDGIVQIPIDADVGVTFASCLRAILRQDPDTILVGEIRDLETAEIAIQAALTGHLVFSTLHTNSAAATITRLKDMGIQAFMICATVEAILAQRLVRRICPKCREEVKPSSQTLFELGMKKEDIVGKTFYRGVGCDHCNNTGYKGRTALFELMLLNDKIRDMILGNASTDELTEQASADGMVSLRAFGIKNALEGITTLEEIVRETVMD